MGAVRQGGFDVGGFAWLGRSIRPQWFTHNLSQTSAQIIPIGC